MVLLEGSLMLAELRNALGAVTGDVGTSGVLDTGMGAEQARDFAQLVQPVLGDWKIGWTTWLLCDEQQLSRKISSLKQAGATVIAGGTAGEIAASRGAWNQYLDTCRELGFDRVEIAEGFLSEIANPSATVAAAKDRDLQIQYEVGRKDMAEDQSITMSERLAIVDRWLEAGADYLVLEAREVGAGFALFRDDGELNVALLEELLRRCPLSRLVIETPNRPTYTATLRHLGPRACLGNIPPAELLRVETMRHALHADTIHYKDRWSA